MTSSSSDKVHNPHLFLSNTYHPLTSLCLQSHFFEQILISLSAKRVFHRPLLVSKHISIFNSQQPILISNLTLSKTCLPSTSLGLQTRTRRVVQAAIAPHGLCPPEKVAHDDNCDHDDHYNDADDDNDNDHDADDAYDDADLDHGDDAKYDADHDAMII